MSAAIEMFRGEEIFRLWCEHGQYFLDESSDIIDGQTGIDCPEGARLAWPGVELASAKPP